MKFGLILHLNLSDLVEDAARICRDFLLGTLRNVAFFGGLGGPLPSDHEGGSLALPLVLVAARSS